ncbi:unnamed protein product [Adineta ricciae]|uniref:Arrestin-like N-terminal domain-containing protein n=1 Tax=Adineta ricciae TaxID=249248 RepID=A0A814RH07_ADIRI|nr:unnamed protein product [Adineta ricciae]
MGTSASSSVQIYYNRSSNFYSGGERVDGIVSLTNTQDNLKVCDIFIELIGELGYTTQETRSTTDSNGNSTTESYTEYHRIPFWTDRRSLAQSKDGASKTVLGPGIYTWPFQFSLAQDLPPSTMPNPDRYPHIKYYTRVVVDRPWYKPTMRKNYPLIVFPRTTINYMNESQQPIYFGDQNRKKLRLQGHLSTSSIVPGQSLCFQLTLDNPERTVIKKIRASLVQCRNMTQDRREDIILRTDLPGVVEFSGSSLQRNFELPVSSDYLTPTHSFTTSQRNRPYNFDLFYELRLEVRTHGVFTKIETKIPVIVRVGPMNVDPIASDNDLPPSYTSVVGN